MESLHTLLQKQFRIFILISFFVHIVVFLSLVFIPHQFTSQPIHIKEAIRVDMVGLPDLIQSQRKAVKKAKPKAKTVPRKKKPPQKKKKTSKRSSKETSGKRNSEKSAGIRSTSPNKGYRKSQGSDSPASNL